MTDESSFRREEDRRWMESLEKRLDSLGTRIEGLESRVVSLTSAQKTTQDDIDELSGQYKEHNELLHGDPNSTDTGLVGQVTESDRNLMLVLRLLHPDNLGHGGLLNEHNEIKRKILGNEKASDNQWKFWSMVAVATISLVGLIIQNWPSLSTYWNSNTREMKTLERKIEKAKHPHRITYVPKVIREESEPSE